ncbi:MAG: nucleoside deaminase [Armatimonadetes bacterium]|nr:nucleoside deaminase [Armatimonadota bacterium]
MGSAQDRDFMLHAIEVMRRAGVVDKTGGPFGCVIVRDGEILAAAGNRVMSDHDPTAHAEVTAIREACKKIGSHDLSGAVMYTSCMCCPMCYAAAFWARVDKIYYASTCDDYADLFDDVAIYTDMDRELHERKLRPEQLCHPEASAVWQEFRAMPDGARY